MIFPICFIDSKCRYWVRFSPDGCHWGKIIETKSDCGDAIHYIYVGKQRKLRSDPPTCHQVPSRARRPAESDAPNDEAEQSAANDGRHEKREHSPEEVLHVRRWGGSLGLDPRLDDPHRLGGKRNGSAQAVGDEDSHDEERYEKGDGPPDDEHDARVVVVASHRSVVEREDSRGEKKR